jgi:hypothetical protein
LLNRKLELLLELPLEVVAGFALSRIGCENRDVPGLISAVDLPVVTSRAWTCIQEKSMRGLGNVCFVLGRNAVEI